MIEFTFIYMSMNTSESDVVCYRTCLICNKKMISLRINEFSSISEINDIYFVGFLS